MQKKRSLRNLSDLRMSENDWQDIRKRGKRQVRQRRRSVLPLRKDWKLRRWKRLMEKSQRLFLITQRSRVQYSKVQSTLISLVSQKKRMKRRISLLNKRKRKSKNINSSHPSRRDPQSESKHHKRI